MRKKKEQGRVKELVHWVPPPSGAKGKTRVEVIAMSVQAIPLMLADADKKLSKGDDSSHPYGQLERERGNVNHDPYSVEESGDIGSNPIREYQKALFLIELYTIRAHEEGIN